MEGVMAAVGSKDIYLVIMDGASAAVKNTHRCLQATNA
jgi:hypothetical protein